MYFQEQASPSNLKLTEVCSRFRILSLVHQQAVFPLLPTLSDSLSQLNVASKFYASPKVTSLEIVHLQSDSGANITDVLLSISMYSKMEWFVVCRHDTIIGDEARLHNHRQYLLECCCVHTSMRILILFHLLLRGAHLLTKYHAPLVLSI